MCYFLFVHGHLKQFQVILLFRLLSQIPFVFCSLLLGLLGNICLLLNEGGNLFQEVASLV